MSWSARYARPIGEPLVAPGIRFSLWDYACADGEDRLATNNVHVISMMLTQQCNARVRHDLGARYSSFGRLGSLLMTPAHVPIHTIGNPLQTRIARLEVEPGRFQHLEGLTTQRRSEKLARCVNIANRDIRNAMRRLAIEAEKPGFSSDLLVEGICSTIVVELFRYIEAEPETVAKVRYLSAPEIRQVTDYVQANLDRRIAVATLADLFGLSERHFSRRFKVTTGQSVYAFVNQARFRHAKVLLSDPGLSIKQVAFGLGFSSPANFSDAFYRQSGERPDVFRRREGVRRMHPAS